MKSIIRSALVVGLFALFVWSLCQDFTLRMENNALESSMAYLRVEDQELKAADARLKAADEGLIQSDARLKRSCDALEEELIKRPAR